MILACAIGWSNKVLFVIFENGQYAADQVYLDESNYKKSAKRLFVCLYRACTLHRSNVLCLNKNGKIYDNVAKADFS